SPRWRPLTLNGVSDASHTPPGGIGARRGAGRAPGSATSGWGLSNTTLGALLASINASIMLIALPHIFRGIEVNPLQPGNGSLLLWLIMGDRARGTRDRRGSGDIPASGLGAVRLAARLQPGAYPARPGARPSAPCPGRLPDQPRLFPTLISPAFAQGLLAAFGFAAVACLIAALASLLRGGRYVYGESAGLAGARDCGVHGRQAQLAELR